MKQISFLFATLSLFVFAAPSFAADTSQCQRIADVDVPYDVSADAASVTFASGANRIVVSGAEINAAGRALRGPQIAPYYGAVRRFLDRSRSMANAALPFSGSSATMSAAATEMCTAILDVAATGAAVEQAFPGFVSPVRVKFK